MTSAQRLDWTMDPSVFHVTHWKAGSQWIRAVLEDVAPGRIVPAQPRQGHVFAAPIVPGGIYTPVYASHEQLQAVIPAGLDHRTFVVVRDPRDTLVSWYFSLRYSHGEEWETVPETRSILEAVDEVDGMAIVLRGELYDAVVIQMTWLDAGAKMFFYEDLLQDETKAFREILDYCQIEIADAALRGILQTHSFERVSGRKRGQIDPRSALRSGLSGEWRKHFPDRLTAMFRTLFGEATVRLGYAPPGPIWW